MKKLIILSLLIAATVMGYAQKGTKEFKSYDIATKAKHEEIKKSWEKKKKPKEIKEGLPKDIKCEYIKGDKITYKDTTTVNKRNNKEIEFSGRIYNYEGFLKITDTNNKNGSSFKYIIETSCLTKEQVQKGKNKETGKTVKTVYYVNEKEKIASVKLVTEFPSETIAREKAEEKKKRDEENAAAEAKALAEKKALEEAAKSNQTIEQEVSKVTTFDAKAAAEIAQQYCNKLGNYVNGKCQNKNLANEIVALFEDEKSIVQVSSLKSAPNSYKILNYLNHLQDIQNNKYKNEVAISFSLDETPSILDNNMTIYKVLQHFTGSDKYCDMTNKNITIVFKDGKYFIKNIEVEKDSTKGCK